MKPPTRIVLGLTPSRVRSFPSTCQLPRIQPIHTTRPAAATISPIHGTGPAPEPPTPSADDATVRLERRKRQAILLERAQDIRSAQNAHNSRSKPSPGGVAAPPPLRKRFWKDVHLKEVNGAWEVHLDTRPLRHPTTKAIVRLPLSKPLLAHALALEWDALVSARQATMQHLIPLTSLVCRALDIATDDLDMSARGSAQESLRKGIAKTVMRYLDTDSLLCWAPPPPEIEREEGKETLRDVQRRTAEEVIGFLTRRVWSGVKIVPVLDGETLMPRAQDETTRLVIEQWVLGLSSWELAALERGVLAGKGLLGAVRLVVEWSEGFVGTGVDDATSGEGQHEFGVEEAAKAASLEVDWQTRKWGEVEDTHDVEKEDLRRQFGSVVLLVSGTGRK
ncbi:uncharacterized protein BCR38DRAFT_338014 [Pseudomassariella vexata]|uniref:ATP12-domain-containing protein n=1 Tax=Pseudomassariella vexata TaxID=1141098 RepID=A0A1Y2E730_9PEZI|nr:uncharacterized protein BCR38DRAFT_338014 [Pseudomassariella vexata]ORY67350.1 hypothetical protein BCR38DRAFT_338014 [Pseudomassariella vexata]